MKALSTKGIIIAISLVAILFSSGCTNTDNGNLNGNDTEPTKMNISNNTSNLDFIILDKEGTIAQELCSERGLNDKIIVLESRYCGACRTAVPRLQEIDQELQAGIIFLDLSEGQYIKTMEEFRIYPQYTPTVLVGCDIYIGAYQKDTYKEIIEAFLAS